MKKKLLALVCALALTFSFAGCTISTPDAVGSIGDFEITSGMYLLAQYGAYQQAAQLAGSDQDASDVKAFLKETITTDSDSGETAPRAILADSSSTPRRSLRGSPVRWFTQSACGTSGAKNSVRAPPRCRHKRAITASWISEPSKTPQPERTIAAWGIFLSLSILC